MYTIYINNTLPPALAVHEIYRDIFGPPMTRHGFCSILRENTAFCVYSIHVKYWCTANSNLAYFIELTTGYECQKQLLMSSISNLGGRESLEIAVKELFG